MTHFDLVGTITIDFRIKLYEPLHVGESSYNVPDPLIVEQQDNPVIKYGNRPYIPGSSLKGALRNHVLRVLNALNANKEEIKGSRLSSDEQDHVALVNILDEVSITTDENKGKEFQTAQKEEKKMELLTYVGLIDRMFGYSGLASPLRIKDALLPPSEKPLLQVRKHVKIHSGTDRAQSRRLYDVEVVDASQTFEGILQYDVLKSDAFRPVHLIFYHVILKPMLLNEFSLFIGGQKSRGHGFVTFQSKTIEYQTLVGMLRGEDPKKLHAPEDAKKIFDDL